MPKKRATDPKAKKRELPARAAHDKKRVEGLFNPASPVAPKPPKEAKKKKDASKKKKKVSRKTKPSYLVMIKRSIAQQNHRNGSSLFTIYKYLEDHYPVSESFHRFVRAALKRGVGDGMLSRVNLSYRLTAKGRATIGKSKKHRVSKKKKAAPSSAGAKRKRSASKEKKKGEKKKSSSSKKKTSSKKARRKKSKGKEKEKEKGHEEVSTEKEAPKKARVGTASSSASSSSAPKRISPAGHKFRWQYQDGAWKDYEMNGSDLVEAAYQSYIKNPGLCDVRAVKSGQWQYQVDFLNLKQTNIQHENHTTRLIRRLPLDE